MPSEQRSIPLRTNLKFNQIEHLKKIKKTTEELTTLQALFKEIVKLIMTELTNLTTPLTVSKVKLSQDKMNLTELRLRTIFRLKNKEELSKKLQTNLIEPEDS